MKEPKADFTDHLTTVIGSNGGTPIKERIIKGTEDLLRYPKHGEHPKSPRGIITFHSKKVKGVSCISISAEDAQRLPAGWQIWHWGNHYAYVLPPESP